MTTPEELILYYYSLNPSWKAMEQELKLCNQPAAGFRIESITDKWKDLGLANAFSFKPETNGFPVWFNKWLNEGEKKMDREHKISFPQILIGEFEEGKIKFPTEELAHLPCVFLDEKTLHPALEKAKINHMWYNADTKILSYNYFQGVQKLDGKLLLEFCDARTTAAVCCNIFVTFNGTKEFADVIGYHRLSFNPGNKKMYLAVPGVAGCDCNKLIKTHVWDLCDSVMDIKHLYFGKEV